MTGPSTGCCNECGNTSQSAEDDDRIRTPERLLHSDEVRPFIEDECDGAVLPAF